MSETAKQRYVRLNRDKINAQAVAYYHRHRERLVEQRRKWRVANADHVRKQALKYYHGNREVNLGRMASYKKRNREKMNAYARNKRVVDPSFAFSKKLRSILSSTLRGKFTDRVTEKHFGCGVLYLIEHIAGQFESGMSWGNYGKWEIDHEIPCRAFNCADERQRQACWHYSNFRPMWGGDNRRKNMAIPACFNVEKHTREFHEK